MHVHAHTCVKYMLSAVFRSTAFTYIQFSRCLSHVFTHLLYTRLLCVCKYAN